MGPREGEGLGFGTEVQGLGDVRPARLSAKPQALPEPTLPDLHIPRFLLLQDPQDGSHLGPAAGSHLRLISRSCPPLEFAGEDLAHSGTWAP